jgi:thioesterase domain-containing protein
MLLDSLGYAWHGEPGERLGYARFARALRDADSALAVLDEHQVAAMATVFAANVRHSFDFEPAVFDGDLLLFRAALGKTEHSPRAGDWAPYATGVVDVREIACTHGEMTRRGPLAEIGPMLGAQLSDPLVAGRRQRTEPR